MRICQVRFSDDFIQELKDRNDISEVISEYVTLKRKGRNLFGLCPFHSEKTASFCVYPGNGVFICFGCGAGGDVITFIRLIEKFDYLETIKFLAQRAGVPLPEIEKDDGMYKKKMLVYEINREVARFYHNCLCEKIGKKALDYLLGRGIKMHTIKHFGLGYAPPGGHSAVDYMKEKGYREKDLIIANVGMSSRWGRCYDRFRDRVMFPIIDLRGNVIAFGGRVMEGGQAKYLNTSDTIVFKKSDNIFAVNFAKNKVKDNLILAEGYMDVISLHQAGFENAVATLGTALTDGQAKLMSRFANEVIISYDSDEAGKKATQRAIKILRRGGMSVKVLSIPKGKDPDEFMKAYGKDAGVRFRNLIENSANDVEYRLGIIRSSYNLEKSDEKVKYLDECLKILCELSSPIECEIYAGKLSEEVGVEKKLILLQVDKMKKRSVKIKEKADFRDIQKNISGKMSNLSCVERTSLREIRAEEALLSVIINNQDMVNNISQEVSSDLFMSELNKKIYETVCRLSSEGRNIDVTTISSVGEFSPSETGYITKIMCSYVAAADIKRDLSEYICVIKNENQFRRLNDVENVEDDKIKNYIENLRQVKK